MSDDDLVRGLIADHCMRAWWRCMFSSNVLLEQNRIWNRRNLEETP